MASVYWLCESRVQHRDNSCPYLEATQPSFSLYISGASWSVVPPLELRVSAWGQVSLQGPFKRIPGSPATFCSMWRDKIANFCSQMLWSVLFLALMLWAMEPGGVLDLSLFRRDLFSWDFPHNSQPLHVGGGQLISHLYLPYQLWHGFFIVLVIEPLFA